jgi:tRNA U34 2-thiouridine synthase MnmA/TrmU
VFYNVCTILYIYCTADAEELKGIRVLDKKESMGICFVGKRKMSDFLPQYFNPTPGR